MRCEYYNRDGSRNDFYTDVYGYLDNVAPEKRTARKFYEIIRDQGVIEQKYGRIWVVQGYDMKEQSHRLKKLDFIQSAFPGVITYQYIRNTPPKFGNKANKLHEVFIDETALKAVPSGEERNADVVVEDFTEEDFFNNFKPKPERLLFEEDYRLSEMALRENTSESRFSDMKNENIKVAAKKIAKLRRVFGNAGVNINVEYDYTLEAKAQVEAAEEGKPVTIKVNPENLSEDTVYHEFGHVFIDLLGVENPTVSQAIQQLKDTELYKRVELEYPELEGDALDKEVLATAIGLEGAKITRKNPNKLQIIVNKILRSFSKLLSKLGIKSATPNMAAKLAEDMFADRVTPASFYGTLSPYVQMSKGENKVRKLANEVRARLVAEREKVRQTPEVTEEQSKEKRKELERLKLLEATLANIVKIESFLEYVNYSAEHVAKMRGELDKLIENVKKDPSLRTNSITGTKIYSIMRDLQALEVLNVIGEQASYKRRKNKKLTKGQIEDLDTLDERITAILSEMRDIRKDFEVEVIPIMADVLMPYANNRVEAELQAEIDLIEKTGRWYNKLDTRTIEYKELMERYNSPSNTMSEEELNQEKVELAIEQLRNRMITNRSDMIRELTRSYKDKSYVSALVDPMIYSNHRAVQLLTKMVDAANQRKNERTLKLKYDMLQEYRLFAEGKNENDMVGMFGELLETIEVKDPKDGEITEVLSLVQPLDLKKYAEAEEKAIKEIEKKYKKPQRVDYKSSVAYYEDLTYWNKSDSSRLATLRIGEWVDANSEPVDGYKKVLKEIESRIKEAEKVLEIAKKNKNKSQEKTAKRLIRILESEKARDFNAQTGKPQGNLVKPKMSLYENSKWRAIQNNPKNKRFYDWYLETYKEKQRFTGYKGLAKNNWETFSYQMPSIRKLAIDKISEDGVVKTGKDVIKDAFTLQETDDEFAKYDDFTGEVKKIVPVFYTGTVDHRLISKDMVSSLYRFSHMAHNFVEKSDITGQVMTIREILANNEVEAVDSRGRRALNNYADRIGIRLTKKQKGQSNLIRHLNQFLDMHMFGEKEVLASIGKVNLNKLANNLNSYVALTNLSFNYLQIGNQFVLDNMTALQETIAEEFYTAADKKWAIGEYTLNQVAALKDIGKFAPETKLGKALELFDGLVDITDQEGNKIVGGLKRKAVNPNLLMFGQYAVEHQVASIRMLSVLHNIKVEDASGNPIMVDGEQANVWDMLVVDKKGFMSIDPRVANVKKEEITLLLRSISKRTNQVKGSFDKMMMQRTVVGKLVGLFRNYLPSGVRRRYGHGDKVHVDEEMGHLTQGMYITALGMMQQAWDEKTVNLKGIYSDMSPMEQANIKRLAVELSSIIAAISIVIAISAIDDDEEKWVSNFVLYQARRYQMEMLQWVPGFGIPDLIRMAESPAATIRPLENGLGLFNQMLRELGYVVGLPWVEEKDIFYSRATARFDKGDRKIRKYFEDMLPIIRGIEKTLNAGDALKWFNK